VRTSFLCLFHYSQYFDPFTEPVSLQKEEEERMYLAWAKDLIGYFLNPWCVLHVCARRAHSVDELKCVVALL